MNDTVPDRTSDRLKLSGTRLLYVQIAVILLLGIAAYANSLHVPRQFDDDPAVLIAANSGNDLWSVHGFLRDPRWFTDVTFAMNRSLHGEYVPGFHLFNGAVHLTLAVAILLLVRSAVEALKLSWRLPSDDDSAFLYRFIPFAAAALFVCHPLQTQAVTYIAQRYTSLTALLYVISLLAFLQARLSRAAGGSASRVRSWWGVSILTALLAMKSKEIAVTLPLMAMVLELALFRGALLKKRLFPVGCALLLLAVPLQLLLPHAAGGPGQLFDRLGAATAETETISRADYLLTQFRVVVTYLRLLVFPAGQNLDHDYPVYHSLSGLPVIASLLLHIVLAGTAAALFRRSGRLLTSGSAASGTATRLSALGIIWFYLALSVESSLIPIRDVIFEHRVYLPSAGFFLVVSAAAGGIAASRRRCRTVLWVVTALSCLVLAAATVSRNRVWSSEMTLWRDCLEKSPDKARPNYSVGMLYYKKYQPEQALPYLVKALEVDPRSEKHWVALNSAVAITGRYKGRCSDGMSFHATAETVNPVYRDPWWGVSFNNLGLAYEFLGDLALARENYLKAVTVAPHLDLAWYNQAFAAALQNDRNAVAAALEKLRSINPLLEQTAARNMQDLLRREPGATGHKHEIRVR